MSKYAYTGFKENMARAKGNDLPISFKQSIELANQLRGMELSKAKALLERIIVKKQPLKMKRFMEGAGHKPGIGSGKYPVTASKQFLGLLNQVEANAENKGLGKCRIIHIAAQKANRPMHHGRKTRIRMKRAHAEVVVVEIEKSARKSSKKHSILTKQALPAEQMPAKPAEQTLAKPAESQDVESKLSVAETDTKKSEIKKAVKKSGKVKNSD